MKSRITSLIAAAVVAFSLVGCSTVDTPYKRGRVAAIGALIAFDDESDSAKLAQVREDIVSFLASDGTLTLSIVSNYTAEISETLGIKQRELTLVVLAINEELKLEGDSDKRAREFLRGVADILALGV